MSKLHDPDLLDSEKPLYVFKQEVICDRLIAALESFYEKYLKPIKPYYIIQLVPSDSYFISYRENGWSCSEKVYITQEQVDKFIQINNVIPMKFVEFIESYKD